MPYYNQLAEAARASGLLAFGHDHVGHGRSEGERVQVGFNLINESACQHFCLADLRLCRLHRTFADSLQGDEGQASRFATLLNGAFLGRVDFVAVSP